jgi:hypothetical protein
MIIGFSANLTDRRIDKYLLQNNYDLAECMLFYSPISGFLFYFGLAIGFTMPFCIYLLVIVFKYLYFFGVYCIAQYLALAYLNNSFVIIAEKLVVINPNFPFKTVKVYELKQIEQVKIASERTFITWLLLIFRPNYVEIYTAKNVQRYYCLFLQEDAYDENITKKTIEDLDIALSRLEVVTEFQVY